MASSYFTLPSFARAKQNQEDLEKTNPKNPVLNDEDEKFLEKQLSSGKTAPEAQEAPATKITDDGKEQEVPQEEQQQAGASGDQVIMPDTKPEIGDGTQDSKPTEEAPESAEDPPEELPDDSAEKVESTAAKAKKSKKSKGFELPSQEDAEAATKGFNTGNAQSGDKTQGQQKTWASYLPSMSTTGKKDGSADQKPSEKGKDAAQDEQGQQRTWTEYASAYVPSVPNLPKSWRKDPDSKVEPVYNEDGTINEEKTKEKQQREVSVLLDNLNMSSFNNRVFSFSGETQKIYERFTLILKDTMAGGPTAYEDMEKLMRDAGPELEKQFASMPPFVQSLVKSLPAKLGGTFGPELLAAASEKPGADMKSRMSAASKQKSNADPSLNAAKAPEAGSSEEAQKKKRKIPGLKGLVSQQGAVASVLRNVVTFIQTRFPFLASMTNVVMSLSVFSKSAC